MVVVNFRLNIIVKRLNFTEKLKDKRLVSGVKFLPRYAFCIVILERFNRCANSICVNFLRNLMLLMSAPIAIFTSITRTLENSITNLVWLS